MRAELSLAGIGLTLVAVFAISRISERPAPSPGKLVARQAMIEWTPRSLSSAMEPARFELVNEGGSTVRILSVESGCGCATPEVKPLRVEPGGSATVLVRAQPIAVGEKRVPITVHTDSTTPLVALVLVVMGGRQPPFVLTAGGDLVYRRDDDFAKVTREVVVETVEAVQASTTPKLDCDLPFIRFDPPIVTERPHLSDPKLVGRTYRFRARMIADPPAGTFSGEVVVRDPWDETRTIPVRLSGEGRGQADLQAVPERLIVVLDPDDERRDGARLLIRARQPREKVELDFESGADCPLDIQPLGRSVDGRVFSFAIRGRPGGRGTEGVLRLVARTEEAGDGSLVIPIMVRLRGSDR